MKLPGTILPTTTEPGAGRFGLREFWICLLPLLVAAGLTSCATESTPTTINRAGGGPAEYREIVVSAITAMKTAQDSLQQLTIHPDRKTFAAFAGNVNRIQVDSVQIRAQAQAMEARGDAYFEEWRVQLTRMNNEPAHQLAEEHRAELKQSCDHIFQAAHETRPIFNSFLTGLRQLRAKLEADPGYSSVDSARALITSTQKAGREVDERLSEILAELNSLSARLASPGGKGPKQP